MMRPADLSFYAQMTLIRQTEQAFFTLYERGLLAGTVHTSIGQEACAVGVMAALEAVSVMAEQGYRPARDVTVVSWMNEEGSRFAPGMMGSEYFAGTRRIAVIRAARDAEGIACGDEIDRLQAAFPALRQRRPFRPA